ncbi:MAG TPA: hypothetical protein ACFYD2_03155 [Candidatus Avalokitesvara rifleensis]|uniref:hypothetical protein n=1 Tax=Candidatus Avalokitesvara rifleensis TaxID=3367620 RepID=UPI0027134F0C|nr:hypothetical protein [Candidatus Brocadiales bacterium]
MKTYIFITEEGLTYQPNSESTEPDIENCQVIGFAEGNSPEEAFDNLIAENGYLLETNFDEIICFELKHKHYHKFSRNFSLADKR